MIRDILFSYDKIEELVHDFSYNYPRELIRHPVTSEYGAKIDSLRLIDTLKSPFTIAFVGQMRSGKSTLLNSVIGAELAPVDVLETTATINWFRYGKKTDAKNFRVYWHDGSISDHPLVDIIKWIGQQENIKKTKWIDFYSDSDLLKITSIIDTPGTRSTIEEHENTTLSFLLEEQTLMQGGSADAIVYVINPNMRSDDKEILHLFGSKTRLPGSSAYNSIAVIQKWEHLTGQAWETVKEKAKKFERELEGKVSCVVPTSGLLANVVSSTTEDIWQELLEYVDSKNLDDIDEDLCTRDDFPVITVRDNIDWRVLPLCCRYAKCKGIMKADDLICELQDLSGVSKLTDLLTKHFISKAKIIKLGSAVNKAAEIGSEVKIRIDQELKRQEALAHEADEALNTLSAETQLKQVQLYVDETRKIISTNTTVLKSMLRKIDSILYYSKLCFDFFDSDIRCLKLMENEKEDYDKGDRYLLNSLFGMAGSSIDCRLNCNSTDTNDLLLETAYRLNTGYTQKKGMYVSTIYSHAIDVCCEIIQNLESIT